MSIKNRKRGEIYYISSSPIIGHEQKGGRPAIIVSNDYGNAVSPVVEVVFVTTKWKKRLPTHVTIHSCKRKSIALCEQITTVDKTRILDYVGKVTRKEMEKINQAIKVSLGMEENNMSTKNELTVTEYKDIRVLTTQQLAEEYGTETRRISENFNANKNRYIIGKHYIALEGEEKREFLNHTEIADSLKNAKTLYLWTEKGAFLHAKSLNTDKAWEVYDRLVDNYFQKPQKQLTQLEILQQSVEILDRHDKEIKQIDDRMDKLEYDIPLYVSEADELSNHVKAKGVYILGGKFSNAYHDKTIRSKIYIDIYCQIKREFNLYGNKGRKVTYKALKRKYIKQAHKLVENYTPPLYLKQLIESANLNIA